MLPVLLPRPPELCHPLSEEEELPELPERLLPTFREELPTLPDELPMPELLPRLPELELCDPVRRLGSFSRFSLRPMFWPNDASESLLRLPMFCDVFRLTLPAVVDDVLSLLILSRLRLSI